MPRQQMTKVLLSNHKELQPRKQTTDTAQQKEKLQAAISGKQFSDGLCKVFAHAFLYYANNFFQYLMRH